MTNPEKLIEMVKIPAGEFMMGSPNNEADRYNNEGPQHNVTVPAFRIGKFPVTQAQWRVVSGWRKVEIDLAPAPSRFKNDNAPVGKVSWYQAMEFCRRLTQATGERYGLPSEAQWEYACRAGTTTQFSCGDILEDNACFNAKPAVAVGSFPSNGFGLHDMHGNVWEWCRDTWHKNYKGAPIDGRAWLGNDSDYHIIRGGSWGVGPMFCRSASRGGSFPDYRGDDIGFRVILAPDD